MDCKSWQEKNLCFPSLPKLNGILTFCSGCVCFIELPPNSWILPLTPLLCRDRQDASRCCCCSWGCDPVRALSHTHTWLYLVCANLNKRRPALQKCGEHKREWLAAKWRQSENTGKLSFILVESDHSYLTGSYSFAMQRKRPGFRSSNCLEGEASFRFNRQLAAGRACSWSLSFPRSSLLWDKAQIKRQANNYSP